ncbi:unnamed protein product [Ectocarpus sp. CCAP 1310/34]|nr:unnamed protein product [Ectocarpus sp. CCAP 1310/34]
MEIERGRRTKKSDWPHTYVASSARGVARSQHEQIGLHVFATDTSQSPTN